MPGLHRQQHGYGRDMMTEAGMLQGLKGRLRYDEPMSRHTSWRVGGPADRFFIPYDLGDLKNFLGQLPENEPVTWIGLGSNLLVRDGGIRGTVIATKNVMNELEYVPPLQIKAGSGMPCARLARFAVKSGLKGAEFLIGIPGTLGGALAMNAGAFGSEIWSLVRHVVTVNRKGEERTRPAMDFGIAYRSVTIPTGEWFISALLELEVDINQTGKNNISEFLARRSQTQPVGESSCGSVFRNPGPDMAAARLIEASGLKGKSIGMASVSLKHANFIINLGKASASDIEMLIQHVQQVVYEKHDIRLIPEVRVLGEI